MHSYCDLVAAPSYTVVATPPAWLRLTDVRPPHQDSVVRRIVNKTNHYGRKVVPSFGSTEALEFFITMAI